MSTSTPACPRCGGVLWGRALPAGHGHACGNCGGVWLDNAAGKRVSELLCSETLGHAEAGARTARSAVDTSAAVKCMTCGKTLERITIGPAKVDVDYCSEHGTWFDKDELARVAQSYATARAYGRHGSGAVVAGAAVAGAAMAGGALYASQHQSTLERAGQSIDAETVADVAIEGGGLAFDAGAAIGDAVDAGEVAGGAAEAVFGILGGIFEGLG